MPGPDGSLTLTLEGILDANTTGNIWRETDRLVKQVPGGAVVVDATGLTYCDGAGIGLLYELRRKLEQGATSFEIRGLKGEFRQLLSLFEAGELHEGRPAREPGVWLVEEVGRLAHGVWKDTGALIIFLGELAVSLWRLLFRPWLLRWGDVFSQVEKHGVNAVPIIALVGFLVGLILAFQAAVILDMFGATMFVADLVALSMFREMGPLMTAIILSGRTGSAFAAELGTMKVNEEIDALTTMGLEPVRFLAATRVVAAVCISPFLAVFANLFGLLGGLAVMITLGYPMVTFINQVQATTDYVDLVSGLVKTVVFGFIVAGVGCHRGLQTRLGAAAVGESTTVAVVYSIVLIIVADGLFSVIYYYLGI